MIFEVFIQKTEDVVGKSTLDQAFQPDNGKFQQISQNFQDKEDLFVGDSIF